MNCPDRHKWSLGWLSCTGTLQRKIRACRIPNPESRIPVLLLLGLFAGFVAVKAREFPPDAPPPKPLVLPVPQVRRLSNGLKIVTIERRSLPLLALRLVVKSGAEADPPALAGTAQFVAGLLTQGTERRSAREIAEAIDLVVHLRLDPSSGRRLVASMYEVTGLEEDAVAGSELFSLADGSLRWTGIRPRCAARLHGSGFPWNRSATAQRTLE